MRSILRSIAPGLLLLMASTPTPVRATETYTHAIKQENAACGAQTINLGSHASAELCGLAAGPAGCTSFMFSAGYPYWGCRCCVEADTPQAHGSWSVYNVLPCSDPSVTCVTPGDRVRSAVGVAESFCDGTLADAESAHVAAATELKDLMAARDVYLANDPTFAAKLAESVEASAAVLSSHASGACAEEASQCNNGRLLLHWLRGMVLLADGNASRALMDSPVRAALFDAHRVYLADGNWLDDNTVQLTHGLYDSLPARLRDEGVLFEAPFATMTVKDAFACRGKLHVEELINQAHLTPRGYNVFRENVGWRTEEAFDCTGTSLHGDGAMTVIRHEVGHQLDRVVDADPKLSPLFESLKAAAAVTDDWLRYNCAADGPDAFFKNAPIEIIASHVGNQFLLSSSTQLQIAAARLVEGRSSVALGWVLMILELFASPDGTQSRMYESVAQSGNATMTMVSLQRDSVGRVSGLVVPGCAGALSVSYATASSTSLPSGVSTTFADGSSTAGWSCQQPTAPTTAAPTATAPATTAAPSAPDAFTSSVKQQSAECGTQGTNLGHFASPELCARAAGPAGCATFMFSTAYPAWGCRCCAQPDTPSAHSAWSVYNVQCAAGYEGWPQCTAVTTAAPTTTTAAPATPPPSTPSPVCECGLEHKPVFCRNGMTYSSSCMATCAGAGRCRQSCGRYTRRNGCLKNERVHRCQWNAEAETCTERLPCTCPEEATRPMVCADGVVYANECQAACALLDLGKCQILPQPRA